LADEPVASLDPALAESVMGLLSRITEVDHKTLILSSRSPYLIQTYCSRIIGIRQGRILFDMPVSEINDDIFHDLYETNQILQS
jgi:phosphonate transport system ATP-binding protein